MKVNVRIYLSRFQGLNYIFSSFRSFVNRVGRQEVNKILYNKCVPMLTIKDDVDNNFSDKFVP